MDMPALKMGMVCCHAARLPGRLVPRRESGPWALRVPCEGFGGCIYRSSTRALASACVDWYLLVPPIVGCFGARGLPPSSAATIGPATRASRAPWAVLRPCGGRVGTREGKQRDPFSRLLSSSTVALPCPAQSVCLAHASTPHRRRRRCCCSPVTTPYPISLVPSLQRSVHPPLLVSSRSAPTQPREPAPTAQTRSTVAQAAGLARKAPHKPDLRDKACICQPAAAVSTASACRRPSAYPRLARCTPLARADSSLSQQHHHHYHRRLARCLHPRPVPARDHRLNLLP